VCAVVTGLLLQPEWPVERMYEPEYPHCTTQSLAKVPPAIPSETAAAPYRKLPHICPLCCRMMKLSVSGHGAVLLLLILMVTFTHAADGE
jgi:hypothetical protein